MRCHWCGFKEVTDNSIDDNGNILCDSCGKIIELDEEN